MPRFRPQLQQRRKSTKILWPFSSRIFQCPSRFDEASWMTLSSWSWLSWQDVKMVHFPPNDGFFFDCPVFLSRNTKNVLRRGQAHTVHCTLNTDPTKSGLLLCVCLRCCCCFLAGKRVLRGKENPNNPQSFPARPLMSWWVLLQVHAIQLQRLHSVILKPNKRHW